MGKDKVNILLVEDDDVAAEKIRRSFRKAELQCDLHHAINGIEALEILRGKGKHKQLSRRNHTGIPIILAIRISVL